jgi:hypothetical protein
VGKVAIQESRVVKFRRNLDCQIVEGLGPLICGKGISTFQLLGEER